ncbi:MAG: hypothetical protein AB7E79_16445 [Rhodospirillaceae bacterium]
MPSLVCRFLCPEQSLLATYTSEHRNPAEAAEAAAQWAISLPYARIDVWDGENRLLIYKRQQGV